ncbi:MAG: endo alpha-1,4 polygalactosaminidase [Polyangiaceae bacterium]
MEPDASVVVRAPGPDARPAATRDGAASNDASTDLDSANDSAVQTAADAPASGRGVVVGAPWVSYYGSATASGGVAKVGATFRVVNVDADPGAGLFTPAQILQMQDAGQNRVISYLDVGSCENYRSWWTYAPGHTSCSANTAAQIGPYTGFPSEVWMNPSNADYQDLIVNYVAPLIARQGVDGFFLDNLEIVEHGTSTLDGPCDATCSQGGLDLVRKLREAFPDKLIVMNNATSDVTRLGTTGGEQFSSLLDGLSREGVYSPVYDATAEAQLLAWQNLGLKPGGRPFWIATEDYVSSCAATRAAMNVYAQSRAKGFSPYATDSSSGQRVICYWGF